METKANSLVYSKLTVASHNLQPDKVNPDERLQARKQLCLKLRGIADFDDLINQHYNSEKS